MGEIILEVILGWVVFEWVFVWERLVRSFAGSCSSLDVVVRCRILPHPVRPVRSLAGQLQCAPKSWL